MSVTRIALLLLAGLLLSGCSLLPFGGRGANDDYAPSPDEIPEDVLNTPDAVPTGEPPSRNGNPKNYTVFGETYSVMRSAAGFKQRGYASWYGKKFHGRNTANGERYDIYGMTAAHKTLPLPTYVRVTNLGNGKTVVVRVNDRGPFHSDRIIDLSYAAAAKLGIIGHGTAKVEIETVDGSEPPPAEPATPDNVEMTPVASSGYLQVATYADPINAVALREELQQHGIDNVEIRIHDDRTPPQHVVVVGPFDDEASAAATRQKLADRSLKAIWIGP